MLLWNRKELPQPPNITYKTLSKELDLKKLRMALEDGIKHFKKYMFLTNELAILSRILYRMKMKFRTSRDFKLLEKLRHSLDTYIEADFSRHLKTFLNMVPSQFYTHTYLPSKNMLLFILVRIQGLAKLMERAYNTCLIIASELNQRLYIGHFWKLFVILFGLVSRIAILVKFDTKFLCELYVKLLHHSNRLEAIGDGWLPKDYELPSDLRSWLGVQWVYEEDFVDLTYEPSSNVIDLFNLVDEDEDDVLFCNEYILLDDEEKSIINDFHKLSPIKETLSHNRMRGFSINEDDLGDDIEAILPTIGDDNKAEDVGDEIIESSSETVAPILKHRQLQTHCSSNDEFFILNDPFSNRVPITNKIAPNIMEKRIKMSLDLRSVISNRKNERKTSNSTRGIENQSQNNESVICLDDTHLEKTPEKQLKRKTSFNTPLMFSKKQKINRECSEVPQTNDTSVIFLDDKTPNIRLNANCQEVTSKNEQIIFSVPESPLNKRKPRKKKIKSKRKNDIVSNDSCIGASHVTLTPVIGRLDQSAFSNSKNGHSFLSQSSSKKKKRGTKRNKKGKKKKSKPNNNIHE
ncbi:nucleolus and neural progenitor protein [Euwallacea fornicatus]|uniref:nucleolus and neural progenitor protein n=1 Tax=Euwallacea fornicatus TaxID=995702 RepID=UPI00338D5CFA